MWTWGTPRSGSWGQKCFPEAMSELTSEGQVEICQIKSPGIKRKMGMQGTEISKMREYGPFELRESIEGMKGVGRERRKAGRVR